MYQAHFGLKRPLFESGIAQEAAVFLAPKHELIVANSKVALTTLDSAVVLTGKAGVGKTTLISSALRTTSTRLALGWITGAPTNGAELLELLLVELGCNAHRVGRVERMQMWRQFLNEMRATESRVFVIVERADDLSHEVLRALDSLTAADANGCPGANLVLLGQPALLEHLKAPLLESLRQRIRLRERLEPLTADELRAYLAHQVARAGGSFDRVFAPAAVGALHALSGGIPRIANNLCETALTLAAAGEATMLTPELLTRIAVAMFGIDVPATPAAIQPAAATVSAAPSAPVVVATFNIPAAVAFAPPSAPAYVPPTALAPSEAYASRAPAAAAPAAATTAFAAPPPPTGAATAPPARAAVPQIETAPLTRAAATPARADLAPLVTRPAGIAGMKPAEERGARPVPAARTSFPPVIPSRASSPPPRVAPEPEIDSFADTLTDAPDVQMPELPVLTDAVEAPARSERPRARTEMAYARQEAPPATRAQAPPATRAQAPSARGVTAPTVQSAPHAARTAASTGPRPAAPTKPAAPQPATERSDEALSHQTQTVRALSAAKSIDDISNSMAETLFGEADLDMLSAALGAAGWSGDAGQGGDGGDGGDDAGAAPREPDAAPAPKRAAAAPQPAADEDPFDLFGLGPDAPLELIDDSTSPDVGKAANNR
jgi:general secretion pathway protein A